MDVKELNTLKKKLEDEQRRRGKESPVVESIQGLDQDKGQSGEEDTSRSGQGNTIPDRPEEGKEPEVTKNVYRESNTAFIYDVASFRLGHNR